MKKEARSDTGNHSNSEILSLKHLPRLIIRNQKTKVDSRITSNVFGHSYDKVVLIIRSLISYHTISPAEFSESFFTTRDKNYLCTELNKAGFLKSVPFIGIRSSREGQKILVDEFKLMENLLAKQSKEHEAIAFQLMHSKGKDVWKIFTRTVSQFIEYARDNGNQNAERYYSVIPQLIYKNFLLITPKTIEIRKLLTAVQLSRIQILELMAANFLLETMSRKMEYKTVYRRFITELNTFTSHKIRIFNS